MAAGAGSAGPGGRPWALRPWLRWLAAAAILLIPGQEGASAQQARVHASEAEGYGRIVLTFPERLPGYDVDTSAGVVVVSFNAAVAPDVRDLPNRIGSYVTAARRDPDLRAARFALARPVTINVMEAGEKLFIDLLPQGWVGMPPGLPADVVAELARRAEEGERKRRRQELVEEARASAPVEVRITSLPTFTRLVFVWDEPPEALVDRHDERARILFRRGGRLDVSGLRSRLPDYIHDIDSRLGEEGLEVVLTVDPQSPVRGFREELTYVVDVTAPQSAEVGAGALDFVGRDDVDPGETATDAPDPAAAPPPDPAGEAEGSRVELGILDTEDEVRIVDIDPVSEPQRGKAEARPPGSGAAVSDTAAPPPDGEEAIRPEARRIGPAVRLVVPFKTPTAAAVFARGGAVWGVFETRQPIDARLLRENLGAMARSVDSWQAGGVTALRIELAEALMTTVAGEGTAWVITLGDTTLEPGEPLRLAREASPDGEPRVVADFPTASTVHEIGDPVAGDRLHVVTAPGPTRAVPKPYQFVEFSALRSFHGLAINPAVDRLDVDFDGERVRIARGGGLKLSEVGAAGETVYSEALDQARPGFVEPLDGAALDPGAVYKLLARHVRDAADSTDRERTGARLRLARALLATDLGAEALAQLNLVERDDPGALRDPAVRALRGIGMVMMGRHDEAVREFDAFGLEQSTDVALWRGMAELARGRLQAAQAAFAAGEPAVSSYSTARQRKFRLAAARVALELNDIAGAAVRLAELSEAEQGDDPEFRLLSARLAAALGQNEKALAGYEGVIAGRNPRLAAEARLRRVELAVGSGAPAERDATIDELERLAIVWRGDEIELRALRTLANLYVETSDYYRAFEIMKSATLANAASPTTRALQDDMNVAFEDLFLGGGADTMDPVEALSLYYDFRELTPVGRKGDDIIRGLADRMLQVDLLAQAAQLLRHQVEHRLKGAARAQVAAKLAWIYLMNRRPAEAVIVLSKTRQAILPRAISYQRLLLEARALAETGRIELALDLLSSTSGPEVDEARADVLWKGEQWQAAGETIERVLGSAWDGTVLLDDIDRARVLRGAISYAMAEDQLGLQRFRGKYLAKMADSPDGRAFDVVTLPVAENAKEFRELVEKIAGTDTLDGFLAEYRQRYVLPAQPVEETSPQS